MRLTLDNRAPVYIQVIQYFKEQIASGELESGGEIPSRRQLANTLKINPNTVQKAYKEMEEAGLIFTDRNMPSRVTEDEAVIKQVRESLLQDAVENFISSVQALHVPLEEVLPLIETKYKTSQSSEVEKNDRG